ncbi:MAG TPA: hypothetical protein VKH40_18150 [Alloacidobacterium sp.]|nr:hypothetical protein [Alloacidobacterium sp.]
MAVYWHLLSLDAPTVAALWCWSFGRVAHIDLPRLGPLLLAVGTWLVYVADRILDGMDRANLERLRERHFFYLQHRTAFLMMGAIVSPVFAWVVFTRMSPAVRLEDAAVFAVAALYFLLVHAHGRAAERWLPKELAVGVLFAAATAVPAWARIAGERLSLVPVVVVFALLCWINCVAIESWESSADLAHTTTAWAARHLHGLSLTTGLLSLALAAAGLHDGMRLCLLLASAVSALLLFWLAHARRHLTAMQLRIGADAALLTPLLFVAWMR